jgi:hypothetical protein
MSEGIARDRQISPGGWPNNNKVIAIIRLRHCFGLLERRDAKRFVSSRW